MANESGVLPKVWNIPESIRNRLGRDAGPQRAISEENHLLIILHQIPGPNELQRRPALFWRQPEGDWRSNLGGAAVAALADLLQAYETKIVELELAENKASTATEYHGVLEQLAPVVRSSRGLHRALQQARDLVKSDRNLINFRDQAASVERNAELLLQDAQFGLNFTVAKQAEAQAETARQMGITAHRLNVLAAVFLPLTALASVFGMEIHSGLADRPAFFAIICAAGIGIGLVLSLMLTRRGR
jgi:Mg2+ and Co2+ transporter CorA